MLSMVGIFQAASEHYVLKGRETGRESLTRAKQRFPGYVLRSASTSLTAAGVAKEV